jgi:hypothetical protein
MLNANIMKYYIHIHLIDVNPILLYFFHFVFANLPKCIYFESCYELVLNVNK